MKLMQAFLLLLIASLIVIPVYAQSEIPPIPSPPPEGQYVLDELDWLTGLEESRINAIVRELDNAGIADIAVVTHNDCGSDKLEFRKKLFDTWGIGHRSAGDGLLILVCWYDGDETRRSVEQFYGPGLNRVLNSSKTDQVAQENFVPAFRQNNPGDGLVAMVKAYDALLRSPKGSNNFLDSLMDYWKGLDDGLQFLMVMLLVFVIITIKERFFSRSGTDYFDRERYPYERDSFSDHGSTDRDSSDRGSGSSTRF